MSVTAVPIAPTRRGILALLWAGIVIAFVVAIGLAVVGTAPVIGATGSSEQFLAYNRTVPGVGETKSGLQYRALTKGEGDLQPGNTDIALVQMTSKLRNGTVLQQTSQPTALAVAAVPPGVSEGLKLMTKGAKYRLWMKPELAFGPTPPSADIPADAVVIYDIELLEFKSEAEVRQIQQMQQLQHQQQMQQQGGAPGTPLPAPPPQAIQ